MLISLLTHPRETDRKTNTGKLAINLQLATLFCWQRTAPNAQLLDHIAQRKTALLYPPESPENFRSSESAGNKDTIQSPTVSTATVINTVNKPLAIAEYEHIIIVDATWQEARKIVNRSPYLHALPRCMLSPTSPSIFSLRRNQKEQGLCTAECVIAILDTCNRTHDASTLSVALAEFIAQYGRS